MRGSWSVLLVVLSTATRAFAWGTEGHSIIAEIAQREMSRPTRDAVDELLGHATLELRSPCT
jgi:hypothetical protein